MFASINYLFQQSSIKLQEQAFCFLRISIGILTILHGLPKILGGVSEWEQLGTFVHPLGIYFWPVFWGLLGALTEFLGGFALVLGFGTRLASFALTIMMFVATVWHIDRGDIFNVYSFPLSLIFVYYYFVLVGSGKYSLDYYCYKK